MKHNLYEELIIVRNTGPDERQVVQPDSHIYPLAQGFHPSSKLCFGCAPKHRFERVQARDRPLYGRRGEVGRGRGSGENPESKSSHFCEVCFKRLRRKLFGLDGRGERNQLGWRKLCNAASVCAEAKKEQALLTPWYKRHSTSSTSRTCQLCGEVIWISTGDTSYSLQGWMRDPQLIKKRVVVVDKSL